ncbi:RNA demethylase ALKBH5 [Capsella rubella]|nr:RNA demethylase ALKBH5 [Capsella rubella]
MDPTYDEDVFLGKYQSSELKIASEFLTTWLPFLSRDLCKDCLHLLSDRIRSLDPEHCSNIEDNEMGDDSNGKLCDAHSLDSLKAGGFVFGSLSDGVRDAMRDAMPSQSTVSETASPRISWADMAQEDGLEEEEYKESESGTHEVDGSMKTPQKRKMSREERERYRFLNVKKVKLFSGFEKVRGKSVNILEGLELHTGVFSAVEQKKIVDFVYQLQEKGRKGQLLDRTFSAPHKWMRGKGRVTIQFGCCYNYGTATDKAGNRPGILQHAEVDPIPSLFKVIIKRLVGWHVLPPTCVPDSCIVNIYEESDCIPPHIDNHDFVRPFCTVSFLSECDILFGSNLKVVGPGEFSGPYSIPLPVGSVLVLNGNGADVAKHCVPAVPTKRISITFRKMDESKRPVGFTPEPDLQGIEPLPYEQNTPSVPDVVAAISTSRSSNDQNGRNHNNRAAHEEGSRHRRSRDYHSESREWSSSSSQRRDKARPTPNLSFRPKVTSSDNA